MSVSEVMTLSGSMSESEVNKNLVSEIKIFHGTKSMSELMSEPMFMSVCEHSSELGIYGPKPVDLGRKRINLEI